MEFIISLAVTLALFGFLWFVVNLLIKKKSVKFASIAITAFCGFLVLYAYVKTAEAEKQAIVAQEQTKMAMQNAAEAVQNAKETAAQAKLVEETVAYALTQQRMLEDCQNGK